MNVDRVNQQLASGAYGRRTNRAGAAGASDAAQAAGARAESSTGDALELSGEAQLIQRAETAVRNAPDVREQVVAQLRQRIQDGSYAVDDQAVAAKLIEGEE